MKNDLKSVHLSVIGSGTNYAFVHRKRELEMSNTVESVVNAMSEALDAKYPNNWVIMLMDTLTGMVDVLPFERTEEGENTAKDVLMVVALTAPLDILVFTNVKA